ncbi:MAG: TonB-dependent receptor [Saprospiraceae bacterium]
MHFLKSFLLLGALLVAFVGQSQSLTITGNVFDASNQEPLVGVSVQTSNSGAFTDPQGKFEIKLPAGEHLLTFSYIGYRDFEKTVNLPVDADKTFKIQLESNVTYLQTATITSGKYEKPLGEVTVSMEVIQLQLLESNNTTVVDEVLEKVPGLQVLDGQPSIRGGAGYSYGAGSRVLLLVDDLPALQADAGFPQWTDVPVENIAQIEVIKGASSALYGSSAMNGVINIRTAYATSVPETKISSFYQAYLSPADKDKQWWDETPYAFGTSVSHKRKIKKLDLVATVFGLNRNSFNQDTKREFYRTNLGLRYRFSDRLVAGVSTNFNTGRLSSFFYWKNSKQGAHQATESVITDTDFTRFFIDPFVNYTDHNDNRHKLLGRLYSTNNEASRNQSNSSDFYYGEYQFQRKFKTIPLVTTAGAVINYTRTEAELYGDTTYSSNNYAAYLQLDYRFFGKLNVSGGLRFEKNIIRSPENFGDFQIPNGKTEESKPVFRLGANYQVAKASFLRASWGQGYRFPTIAEKFIRTDIGVPIVPNPALTSETGWTSEIGFKQGFQIGEFDGFIDLAGFWTEYQDMMEFNLEGTVASLFENNIAFQSSNVGDTEVKGIELSVGAKGNLGAFATTLIGGYTFIDPKFKEFDNSVKDLSLIEINNSNPTVGQLNAFRSSSNENILKYRSKHTFKIDLETKYRKVILGMALLYSSNVEAIDAVFENIKINAFVSQSIIEGLAAYREENNQGFKVLDLRLGYQILPKLKLMVIAKNILNEEYMVRPGLLEAPRNITARVDFAF